MSNSLAIGAVTATLRNLLQRRLDVAANVDPSADEELNGTKVTALPPDEAQQIGPQDGNRLNVFLYQTSIDGALRNLGRQPPLPLTLHYLVTPYVNADSKFLAHRLLGRAMSILHDHPVLGPEEIEAALAGTDLHLQSERVRIVPESLSTEELSKLWPSFQAKFRTSASYQVSVVLIDSIRPEPSAPPVLSQGSGDRGPSVMTGRSPSLSEARPPAPQRSVRLGEELTLVGEGLDEAGLQVRVDGPHLDAPVVLSPLPGSTANAIRVLLAGPPADPNSVALWASGIYSAAVVVSRQGMSWTSNEVPFAFSPTVVLSRQQVSPGEQLMLRVSPRLRDDQRVVMIFGDRQVAPDDVTQASIATFTIPDVPAGRYLVRLRVDGIESIPVVRNLGPPPTLAFDERQIVTVP